MIWQNDFNDLLDIEEMMDEKDKRRQSARQTEHLCFVFVRAIT